MDYSSLEFGSSDAPPEFRCPYDLSHYCNTTDNAVKQRPLQISRFVAIPAICSCVFSCVGSILIVYTYCRWKDIRTGSRKIITFLSIADFITALGYIIGSVNYLINFDQKESCDNFNIACQIQSFITTTSSLSSFIWTSTLAIYLYISVVHNKGFQAQRFFPLYHMLGWGVPLIITVPILATENLGYSTVAVSTWCYVKDTALTNTNIILTFMAGKLWEILTYIIVFVLYFIIKIFLRRQVAGTKNPDVLTLLRKSDRKLIFIPIIFVLLRMWGTIQFFFNLGNSPGHICGPDEISITVTVLGILQAIGDGGLGWGNLLLYIMASDKIRNRLLNCQKSHKSENKRPILFGHDLQQTNSDFDYGGIVNTKTKDVSEVPTTV